MAPETEPLLSNAFIVDPETGGFPELDEPDQVVVPKGKYRASCARFLDSKTTQWMTIILTVVDSCFTLTDIGYDFLKDPACLCTNTCPPPPEIFETFSFISSCITGLFVAELPVTLFAFGVSFYLSTEHHWLHCFDATVILATFVMEILLRGREAEIAGLLIILRLWRLIKLVTSVVDLDENIHEETWKEMLAREKDVLRKLWEKERALLLYELGRVREELHLVKAKNIEGPSSEMEQV